MSEQNSTHERANRHTHGCLLALARVTVFPPMALRGHASPHETGNSDGYYGKKKKKMPLKVLTAF